MFQYTIFLFYNIDGQRNLVQKQAEEAPIDLLRFKPSLEMHKFGVRCESIKSKGNMSVISLSQRGIMK